MIKTKYLLLLAFQALLMSNVMAQDLKTPTLEDLIPGGETYRFAENLHGVQWWGDECVKPDIETVVMINPVTGKEQIITTRQTVNKTLKENSLDTIQHFYNVSFPWKNKREMLIQTPGRYVIYDWKNNQVVSTREYTKGSANRDYNIASGNVAYTIGNNLFVNDNQVTAEPEGIVSGQAVHRSEFGIRKGTFWSPKGNKLAFYRMDESMVTEYPLVDVTARIAKAENIRYPMAGMTSHEVTVGVYNPTTDETIYLNAGNPEDRYFTNISWSPDESKIYLIELNRDQNHAQLCEYDANTGDLIRVLFEEKHDKYVEPQSPIEFLPWNDNQFIYQSQKDGYTHLYLYNIDGQLIRQLTEGPWLVQDILGYNPKTKEVIIASTENSPLQRNTYRVNTTNGKRTLIGNAEGVHRATLSGSGEYIIDNYSTPTQARNIDIVRVRDNKAQRLLTAENPYKDFKMPTIQTGTIKAADGVTDLYYRLITPADMDATQQHPAIVYVYGGPHAQMVNNGFMNGARGWDLYMANKGYVMLSIDNRGSSNRGLEFENATFRQLGIVEGEDQVKGAEFLQSLPYVDGNRIGVHGWSFGGHMTAALMLRYPEIYKVGVSGGPVIDWKYYEVMYGERYMDTPESNPEGYEATNLNNLAGNLKGRLLMIHDDHDDTCVPQHALSFMKACVDARTYPDLFLYPGHKHNVLGRDRVHLHETITRYFEDHL